MARDLEVTTSQQKGVASNRTGSSSLRASTRSSKAMMKAEEEARFGYERRRDRTYEWMLQGPAEGGPQEYSLLLGFHGHVASAVYRSEERGVLTCHSRYGTVTRWPLDQLPSDAAQALVRSSGLSYLGGCMFENLNMPLLSAFVERWHPETNSFHLPFGEMTITLHDVQLILGIPVEGLPVEDTMQRVEMIDEIATVLDTTRDEVQRQWRDGGIKYLHAQHQCMHGNMSPENQARGYLMHLLGATLFCDKSRDRTRPSGFWSALEDPAMAPSFSWGSAALAYLYYQLGTASRIRCRQLAGCVTLLQAWIYEYFPMFAPQVRCDWDPTRSRAMRWRCDASFPRSMVHLQQYRMQLDQLTADRVVWMPYSGINVVDMPMTLYQGTIKYHEVVEPYMPGRVLRQFGFVQTVPVYPIWPVDCYRPAEPKKYIVVHHFTRWAWSDSGNMSLRPRDLAEPSHLAAPDYMQWFKPRTHIRVQNSTHIPPSLVVPQPQPAPAETIVAQIAHYMQHLFIERRANYTDTEMLAYAFQAADILESYLRSGQGGHDSDADSPPPNTDTSHRSIRRRLD